MNQDAWKRLCSDGRRDPSAISVGSEATKGRAANQVSLEVERVVDGCVGGQEPLG